MCSGSVPSTTGTKNKNETREFPAEARTLDCPSLYAPPFFAAVGMTEAGM